MKILVMLMLYLVNNEKTTADFFADVVYQQNIKTKTKTQTVDIMKSEDFFRVLQEQGIRKNNNVHANLATFLQLSPKFPDLVVLKSIKRTLEQMASNEQFMAAIQEDLLYGEEQEALEQMDPAEREAYLAEMDGYSDDD